MHNSVEDDYFRWLCSEVDSAEASDPVTSHWELLKVLHSKEFIWLIPNDDNRVADGLDLRTEYANHHSGDMPHLLGCTVLEMMVGVSRALAFQTEGEVPGWFWVLVNNLGLMSYTDYFLTPRRERKVDEILENLIWRTYEYNGKGGLFPLDHPEKDQRGVEIWYQLCAYILERF